MMYSKFYTRSKDSTHILLFKFTEIIENYDLYYANTLNVM